jgi:hypothetical protein
MKIHINKELILEDVYNLGVGDSMDNLPKMIAGTKHLASVGYHKIADPITNRYHEISQQVKNFKPHPNTTSDDHVIQDGDGNAVPEPKPEDF